MITVHIDGASRGNPGHAGIGVIGKTDDKVVFQIGEYIGQTTNNVAEYNALIRGLQETLLSGNRAAYFYSDSELLVNQVNGKYKVRHENLIPLYHQADALIKKFSSFKIAHVRREFNKEADMLANEGIDNRSIKK